MRRPFVFIFTWAFAVLFAQSASYAIDTVDLNSTTATDLAQSLVGTGISISNVTFTGANAAAGSFSGASADGLSVDSGVVLSSGDIANAKGPNSEDGKTTSNSTSGDLELQALAGTTTYDAAILEFDFVPVGQYFSFLYVFASEEYNEYVGSQFNDIFAFFLDGENIALIPLSEEAVSINNVNRNSNSEFFNNNDPGDLGEPTPYNTQFDGFTTIMWAQAIVTPGQSYHIKLAIADAGDAILDSAVFIQAGSFSSTIPVIAVPHTSYDYGGVGLGSTKSATFTVTNPGEGNLTIGSITITGANSGEFSVKNSTCPQGILGPSQSCTFDVEFAPTTVGEKEANIQIISNAFETPLINIPLTGSGELYIALNTQNGAYMYAVNGGGNNVTAQSYTRNAWTRFSLRELTNGKYALKTYSGNWVTAANGGGGDVVAVPMTNWSSNAHGSSFVDTCGGRLCWENFTLIDLGNYQVVFQTQYGYYLSAVGGGGGDVVATATSIGDNEIFDLIYLTSSASGTAGDVEDFVTRFYQQVLNREPDTPGLNNWVNNLIDYSLSGADVANGFIFSQEFTSRNTSNEEFVTILYRAFFDREPDTPGYTYWLSQLNSGSSRQTVLNGFIYSREFENLCTSYSIAPYSL